MKAKTARHPSLETLDRIYIDDLALRCTIGINPEERSQKQDVVISVVLYTDLAKAGRSDSMEDTVDYKTIKKRILPAVESSTFLLVERLAQAVADLCLEAPRVAAVRVRVDKPGALRFARTVGVEILRWPSKG